VLVIDEVLAVGDAAFQQKAFGRIMEMVRRGTPVVVVSHQLDQIAALCTHALVLDRGTVVGAGAPGDCIATYLSGQFGRADVRETDAAVRIEQIQCPWGTTIVSGEQLRLSLACVVRDVRNTARDTVGLRVRSLHDGVAIFSTDALRCGAALPADGWYGIEADLQLNVPAGAYLVESYVYDHVHGWEVSPGPRVRVDVGDGAPFSGTVQMNPAMRIPFAGPFVTPAGPDAPGQPPALR
jgi:hypothetical protein